MSACFNIAPKLLSDLFKLVDNRFRSYKYDPGIILYKKKTDYVHKISLSGEMFFVLLNGSGINSKKYAIWQNTYHNFNIYE